jgi:hypothetical protein
MKKGKAGELRHQRQIAPHEIILDLIIVLVIGKGGVGRRQVGEEGRRGTYQSTEERRGRNSKRDLVVA